MIKLGFLVMSVVVEQPRLFLLYCLLWTDGVICAFMFSFLPIVRSAVATTISFLYPGTFPSIFSIICLGVTQMSIPKTNSSLDSAWSNIFYIEQSLMGCL